MRLSELAFFVDDVDGTADFYERLLGSAPAHRGDGIVIFRTNDLTLLIHRNYEPGEGELPAENHVAFSVAELDSAVVDLTASGITILVPPRDYYWGRSAYLRDPNGQLIELTQAAERA